ncbi:flagellar type III secretion system protein FliR [Rhizobium sp. KVB221]|uniref:Flagellar type III secretion system protein FliR n=1 Tax=Rhizobium setariae TaxID=2801340 RepID=A0A937CKP7_9HYPH|nr:flagellar biosynthetic protein FliR [Rhizobium setariae]MBL0370701.1 flagellar type III secretion system protein FliR [Rhizobium setariae]
MIQDPEGMLLALILAFCRIGGCIMVLPGFSTARVPVNIRLMMALTISLAMMPLMWDSLYPKVSGGTPDYVLMIGIETVTGVVLGLVTRFYALGLQFLGTVVTMMIGLNTPPAGDVLEDTSEGQLTNLLTFAGLMVLFMLDFHHQVFLAVAESYRTWPPGGAFDSQKALVTLVDTLAMTFTIMLRLASPFILFNVLFNVAIGFINKLAPIVPVYFISTPYQVMGGMLLFYFGVTSMLSLFADAFGTVFR